METVTISKEEYEALQRKAQRKGHGWQVMNAATGLFSTGGRYPRWTKGGKVYSAKGHVLSHLRMLISDLNHLMKLRKEMRDAVGMCKICSIQIYARSSYELRTRLAWHKLTHSPDDFKKPEQPPKELLIF